MAWFHQAITWVNLDPDLLSPWPYGVTRPQCSAAAKRSPGRQMRPMKRSGDPDITKDWQPKNFFCKSPCLIVPDNVIKLCIFFSNIFMSDHPKFAWTIQRTNWVVHWATQDFSLAAALHNEFNRGLLCGQNMETLFSFQQLLWTSNFFRKNAAYSVFKT